MDKLKCAICKKEDFVFNKNNMHNFAPHSFYDLEKQKWIIRDLCMKCKMQKIQAKWAGKR